VTTILNPDNRLFTLARQGRRPPSALAAIAVVFFMVALVVIPGQMLARLVVRLFPSGIQSIAGPIVENIVGFLPIYLGLWVWLRLSSKRPFRSLGLESQGAARHTLGGALIAALMMAVTAGLAISSGATAGKSQMTGLTALGIRLLSLMAYLVQGPGEEVLFRGWLLGVIGARYRPWIGVLVSSLVFSLAHAGTMATAPLAPLAFLNLFLFGLFAAFYALFEGGLWGICVWHAVWNWTMGDLLGFATDGVPHTGLLISIRATGPDIITGGAFGLEGGLACTAVFLIATGIIAMRTRRSGEGRLTATS
jgi:membrane protease YdiL (CAAX protease family)